jgi:hypothetical protein
MVGDAIAKPGLNLGKEKKVSCLCLGRRGSGVQIAPPRPLLFQVDTKKSSTPSQKPGVVDSVDDACLAVPQRDYWEPLKEGVAPGPETLPHEAASPGGALYGTKVADVAREIVVRACGKTLLRLRWRRVKSGD